jgi:hypothetical protein
MTTIEVGKFYKFNDGWKAEVFAIRDGRVLAAYKLPHGKWDANGFPLNETKDWSPWIDEPAIPWDSVPEWLEWWAVDKDGCQFYYESKPILHSFDWAGYNSLLIPKSLRIPYVGDWRESLRQRPGKEVAK